MDVLKNAANAKYLSSDNQIMKDLSGKIKVSLDFQNLLYRTLE